MTCTAVDWIALFADPDLVQIILDSWKFLQRQDRITIYAYVIMENHLHFIAASKNLSVEIAAFKSFTARSIVDHLAGTVNKRLLGHLARGKRRHKTDRMYQVWQEGSHPEEIMNDAMFEQKVEYIHTNPVKRGYVDDPVHWRYSSARNYEGMEGLIEVCTEW